MDSLRLEVLNRQKAKPIRKYGRKDKSSFRLGFEQLAQAISAIGPMMERFLRMVELFSLSMKRPDDRSTLSGMPVRDAYHMLR
ncbi:MAG: hypothetical protein GY846_07795 [Deltaproteobacteria bacterium]|nr:hypothetical protein [Deltaproteobacteria bacterium]